MKNYPVAEMERKKGTRDGTGFVTHDPMSMVCVQNLQVKNFSLKD